jgi:hypothetical protein
MDMFEEMRCTMGSLVWKRRTTDVCMCTDFTGWMVGIVELEAIGGGLESFNAYVTH